MNQNRKIENYKAVGIEFQVDKLAPAVKKQLNPSVHVDDNGNGVIVWDDDRNANKYLYGIKLSNYYPVGESAIQFTTDANAKNSSNASPRMSINSLGRGMIVTDAGSNPLLPDIYGTRLRDFYSQWFLKFSKRESVLFILFYGGKQKCYKWKKQWL